jgi:hypothetical protein
MILFTGQPGAAVVLGILSFVLAMLFRRALDPDARSGEGEDVPEEPVPLEDAGEAGEGGATR